MALLGYTGQPLQLFHVLVLMSLLGIGVDYGIFMQENVKFGHAVNKEHATARLAIGLPILNMLLSFGLLALSNTPALRAFGVTMLIGMVLVWVVVSVFRRQVNIM